MSESSSARNTEEEEDQSDLYKKVAYFAAPIVLIGLAVIASVGIYYGTRNSGSTTSKSVFTENPVPTPLEDEEMLQPRAFFVPTGKTTNPPDVPMTVKTVAVLTEMLQKTHVVFKTAQNFTNAEKMCANSFSNGMLAFPETFLEEDHMMASFINFYEKNKDELKLCEDEFFIGIRKVLDEEWLTPNGEFAAFGPPISELKHNRHHDFPNEHCTQILFSDDKYYINNINCNSHTWNCFVCQHPCANDVGTCYSVHRDPRVHSFREGLRFCEFYKTSSTLAVVPHNSVLKEISQLLKLKGCKSAGIGHIFGAIYESTNEKKLPYQTNRIYYRPGGGKHITYNCIVINAANQFKWEVESCSKPHCYVCFGQ